MLKYKFKQFSFFLLIFLLVNFFVKADVTPDITDNLTIDHRITPNTTDVLGDLYDYESGSVNFTHTDVELPGNSSLRVAFSRSYHGHSIFRKNIYKLKDWDINIPQIRTVVPARKHNSNGQQAGDLFGSSWVDGNECTGEQGAAGQSFLTSTSGTAFTFSTVFPDDYWHGLFIDIPGSIHENLVDTLKSTKEYTTKSNWKVTCINNSSSNGEGFQAISPEGTVYTFDVRVTLPNQGYFAVAKLYASKVEDRFGNYVTYKYTGDKLDEISANDGRKITITYLNGYVEKVTANGRQWQYDYLNDSLNKVRLPNDTFWEFNFENMNNDRELALYSSFSCRHPLFPNKSNIDITITSPQGLIGNYTFNRITQAISGKQSKLVIGGSIVDGMSSTPTFRDEFTLCYATMALRKKVLSGGGISSDITWEYAYSDSDPLFPAPALAHIKPPSLDMTHHKAVRVLKPDNSVSIHYLNKRYNDIKNGQVIYIQHFEKDSPTELLEQTGYFYSQGDYLGNMGRKTLGHIKKIENRVNLVKTEVFDKFGTEYITEFSDFNSYGVARKKLEYNSFSTKRKYTKQSYAHDTDKWILNQPTTTEISKTDDSYTTTSEITYYAKTHPDYPFLPEYEKWYGAIQKHYESYHTSDGSTFQKGNVFRVEYNKLLTDGNSRRYQKFDNYKRGKPQEITLPKRYTIGEISIERQIDDNGWVKQTKDLESNITNYGYDNIGRIKYIDAPDEWADTFFNWSEYSSTNRPKVITTRCELNSSKTDCEAGKSKFRTTTIYDVLLRPISVQATDLTTNSSVYQVSRFNAFNNLLFESFSSFESFLYPYSAELEGTSYTYDGLQRLRTESVNGEGEKTSYYMGDNKIRVIDARGNETTTAYLAYGYRNYEQVTRIESPENITTDIEVNIFGNITSIKQSGKNHSTDISLTEYRAYDSQKRLCQIKRDDVGTTVFKRNTIGEVEWQAEGQTSTSNTVCNSSANDIDKVNFIYDNLGDKRTISYGDNTPTTTFSYDDNGNIRNITNSFFSQSYTYNSLNLLEDETLTIAGRSGSLVLDYDYDVLGNLAYIKYPDTTEKVSFLPNGFGQATQVIRNYKGSTPDDIFIKADITYYPNGYVNNFTYGNDIVHQTTLNSRKIPEKLHDYSGNSDILNLTYLYDNNLNITSITNTRDNSIYSLSDLIYDDLDRLVTTTGGQGIGSSSITYDGLGNIGTYSNNSSSDPHNLNYSYTNNRLTSITGTGSADYDFSRSDSYDTRGNVTHNGKRAFTYNLANQMTDSGSSHFTYDGYNRRIKSVKDNGKTEYTMYSQSGKLLYRETDQGGINYIYLNDKLVAKEGAVSADSIMNYKPYGDSIEDQKDDVGYTGHKFDTDLGLSYMQARYYDPVIGRFYSNDPVGSTGHNSIVHGFNRYAYANNNPYKYADPDGNSPISVLAKQTAKVGIKQGIQNMGKRQMRRLGRYMSQGQRKEFMSDVTDVLGSLDSSPLEIAFELIPVAGDIYGAGKFGKQVASAYDQMQNLENKWAEKIYNSLPADQKKKFVNAMRNAGVRDAKQDAGLPRTGSGLEGHHVDPVANNKSTMSDPRNIQMLTPAEHKKVHQN